MSKTLVLPILPLCLLASCFVSTPNLETDTFACTDGADCAHDYVCNPTLAVCVKKCSVPSDCPATDSGATCTDGMCGDACGAKEAECASKNEVCVVEGGAGICKRCNLAGFTCKNPNKVCVKTDPSTSDATCAPICTDVGGTCNWPPPTVAHCVKVKNLSASGDYVPVCAPCPSTCSNNCFSAAENKSETYAGATTCVGGTEDLCGDGLDNDGDTLTDCADPDCGSKPVCGTCSSSTMCGLGRCVSSKCQPSCETAACSGNAACVYARETPTLAGTKVCKPCTNSCSSGEPCSYAGSTPGTAADFDTIPVDCKAAWYDPATMALSATGTNIQLALAFDSSGQLYLAWVDGTANVVKVRYVDATGAWTEAVAGSSPTNGVSGKPAHDPAIAFTPGANSPHVAWSQGDAAGISHVYWSTPGGTLWTNYGVVGTPTSHNSNTGSGIDDDPTAGNPNEAPAIGFDSFGVPVIVWQHKQVTAYEVHGRFYEASTDHWLTLGKHATSFGVVSDGTPATTLETHPSMAASGSTLYVAWVGVNAGHNTAMVRALPGPSVGATWVAGDSYVPPNSDSSIGVTGINLDTALAPAMATDAAGYPLVAFHGAISAAGDRQLFVLKSSGCTTQMDCYWDGYAGGTQPAVAVSGRNLTKVSMGFFPGTLGPGARPFIAYQQDASIRVRHYTTQWEGIDGSDLDPGLSGAENAANPKLAVYTAADSSGVVCVAWASGISTDAIRVRCHHVM